MKNKKIFSFLEVMIITITTAIIMSLLSAGFIYKDLKNKQVVGYTSDTELNKLISHYNALKENYYEDIDTAKVIDSAIEGMYSSLDDPYTSYLDSNSTSTLVTGLTGTYRGVGISILLKNNVFTVFRVYVDTPAFDAGLDVNDQIIKINNESVDGLDINELSDKIKTSENDVAHFTVLRHNKEFEFDVEVKTLDNPVVTRDLIETDNKKIGYIRLQSFSNSSHTQFRKNLELIESENIDSLIIDLRSNTGGYLEAATEIAEQFLEKNKVIYTLESKKEKTVYKDKTDKSRSYDIVVLINGSSASASEVLSSALRDSYGAKLVGTKSFGKGKVQEFANLNDKSSVKFTSYKWLTPNNTCIDEIGLEPDEVVEFDAENYNSYDYTTDNQIMKAVEMLNQ